ncbi:hypothetical protein [Tunturiibacter gelidiferens]|uniref:hypothetical protein n=1 Tax=Tunturiibacter gelidiferens TaxID=3069689 RepID=UPI003D9B8078
MTLTRIVLLTSLPLTLSLAPKAFAQSSPAATQQLQLSAFAGGTGTFTNLAGEKPRYHRRRRPHSSLFPSPSARC